MKNLFRQLLHSETPAGTLSWRDLLKAIIVAALSAGGTWALNNVDGIAMLAHIPPAQVAGLMAVIQLLLSWVTGPAVPVAPVVPTPTPATPSVPVAKVWGQR